MAGVVRTHGVPIVLSASGTVKNAAGVLIGILVNASSSGTLDLYDTATAGATPSGQPHFVSALPLTAGQYVPIPASFANGLQAVIGGTATVTFFYS